MVSQTFLPKAQERTLRVNTLKLLNFVLKIHKSRLCFLSSFPLIHAVGASR